MTTKRSAPNLQSIPLRTQLGRDVRKALAYEIPLEMDFASLEERILQTLIDAEKKA